MKQEGAAAKTMAIVFGTALVLLGGLFLAGGFIPGFSMAKLWPLFMLIPVLFFIPPLMENGKAASGVLIPGTILLFLTAYFLVLNYTGWELVSKTWPNFILAPALGLFMFYLFNPREKGVLIPVAILTALTVVFYGVTLNSRTVMAACFIVLGAGILVWSLTRAKTRK